MSFIKKPRILHPRTVPNGIGLTIHDYEGAMSTLCAGCGHDSVSAAIIQSFFELDVPPHRVAKLSGIGCSSKTPTYFLRAAHGFNSVHGRMPSIATGANAANRELHYIGISGDGDSLSIGLGQLCHAIRRNVNMLYVIENNGVYGLTKGQFSASADMGSTAKKGEANHLQPIDPMLTAIDIGGSFVARGFSGDKQNLVPLIKAGIMHRGFALLDVISPCVTFNDHEGSTKSYAYAKDHDDPLEEISFVPFFDDIEVEYEPGTTREVEMHDGSKLFLKKLEEDYNPLDKLQAMRVLSETRLRGEYATGLIYLEPDRDDFLTQLNLIDEPLAKLGPDTVRPPKAALDKIMAALK